MDDHEKLSKLRIEAEARLKRLSEISGNPTTEEIKSVVHELSVYQIELEMQNEELRKSQHQLEESRNKYTDLFEFAPLGYFILDRNGLILNCNLTGCGLLGTERSRLIGKPFSVFVSSGDITTFRKYLHKIFSSEKLEYYELLLKRKHKHDFTARLDTIVMKDEHNEFSQCRMAIKDISKEKKADTIKPLMEAVLFGQESEREQIAAELHDSINPLLSIASLNADTLLSFHEKKEELPTNLLEGIISLMENAMQGIKEISANLSPAVLKNFGLKKALEQLCNKVSETDQFKVSFQIFGLEDRLNGGVELALYRVAQELLNNIIKHADATEVEIQLIQHKDSVVLMISDNGIGFDAASEELKTNGFGFKNINSRMETLNGLLSIDSSKGRGTTITVEVPV